MEIWMKETKTKTHHIINFHREEHSDCKYLGKFDDIEFKNYLLKIDQNIDSEKNLNLLKYYGYLHLFISL